MLALPAAKPLTHYRKWRAFLRFAEGGWYGPISRPAKKLSRFRAEIAAEYGIREDQVHITLGPI